MPFAASLPPSRSLKVPRGMPCFLRWSLGCALFLAGALAVPGAEHETPQSSPQPEAAAPDALPKVFAWGLSPEGQTNPPLNLTDVVAVSAGNKVALALKSDGTVIQWGGKGYYPAQPVPQGLNSVVAISCRRGTCLALKADGTVVAWGESLGAVNKVPADLTDVAAIACGTIHALALKRNGTVVAWGGNNTYGETTVPPGLNNVVAVAVGESHSLALRGDGTVVVWGNSIDTYNRVPAGLANVVAIAASASRNLALRADGSVVAWGYSIPVPAEALSGVVALAPALESDHVMVLKEDGSLVTWGSTTYRGASPPAALGAASAITTGHYFSVAVAKGGAGVAAPVITSPAFLLGSRSFPFHHRISTTHEATSFAATGLPAGLQINGETGLISGTPTEHGTFDFTVTAGNASGTTQRTLNLTINPMVPLIYSQAEVRVGMNTSWSYQILASNSPTHYAASGLPPGVDFNAETGLISGTPSQTGTYMVTLAATNDHGTATSTLKLLVQEVILWGRIGTARALIPADLEKVVGIALGGSHCLALKSNGTVVGWGVDTYGQATPPAGLNHVVAIAAGSEHSLALKADGTVVAWGRNFFGEGSVPPGLSGVVALATHYSHNLALKSDGTVVGWPPNSPQSASTIPASLGNVQAITTCRDRSLALKKDGTVVAWGSGTNSTGSHKVPTGLGSVTAIASGSSHSLALLSNGNLVVWGDLDQSTSIPVTAQTGVVAVGAGEDNSLALKADGTVVEWGMPPFSGIPMPAGLRDLETFVRKDSASMAIVKRAPVAPEIAPLATSEGRSGTPYNLQLLIHPVLADVRVEGLPSGLQYDKANRRITGIPSAPGTSSVVVSVSNDLGQDSEAFQMVIQPQLLELTNPPPSLGEAGASFQHELLTLQPASNLVIQGLPPGLTFSPATAVISGTPTQAGTFAIELTGVVNGGFAAKNWTLEIRPAIRNLLGPNSSLTLSRGGASSWFIDTGATAPSGTGVGRSGSLASGQESWIETTVTGPGVISFDWRVESPSSSDKVEFRINNVLQERISGNVVWQRKAYSLASGLHTLRWRYSKGSSHLTTEDVAQLSGVKFTGALAADNAYLSSLWLNVGTLTPAFATGTTNYTALVPASILRLIPVPMNWKATVQVRVNSGNLIQADTTGLSTALPLNLGANTVEVKVTAEDGTTSQTYTFAATRIPSSNAELASLTVPGGTFTQTFAPFLTNYTVTVPYEVTTARLDGVAQNELAQLVQTPAGDVPLALGDNLLKLAVTAEDGTPNLYTVKVVRLRSTNANLAGLTVAGAALSPAFHPDVTQYNAKIRYAQTSTELTATPAHDAAVAQQTPANPVALAVGVNNAQVKVTAQNGTTVKTYTIAIQRATNMNARLGRLEVAGGTLSPAFDPAVTSYTATVGNAVTQGMITAVPEDEDVTVQQTPPGPLPLSVGTQMVNLNVTAVDGVTVKTYTLALVRTPPDKVKPLVKLTAPASPFVTGPFTISGVVKENTMLASLTVKLNGAVLPLAAPLNFTANKDVAWSVTNAQPQEGMNAIQVEAVDVDGNRTTLSTQVERRHLLILTRDVPGPLGSTPDKAGTLALTALPAKNATAQARSGLTQAFAITPGSLVSVTATAKGGHLFSHWAWQPTTQHGNRGTVVYFLMPASTLDLRAVFASNAFTMQGAGAPVVPAGGPAVFQGLLRPAANENDNSKVAHISLTLTPAQGSLSGKISHDGKVTSFTAVAHANGSVWIKKGAELAPGLAFAGRSADRMHSLYMTWDREGFTARLYNNISELSAGVARPPLYSRTWPITPDEALPNSPLPGYHTLAFPAMETSSSPPAGYPGGAGHATLTLLKDGTFKLTGVLADGTKITTSSFLTRWDQGVTYIALPTPGASTRHGSLLGHLLFVAGEVSATDLRWFRPAAQSKTTVVQAYRAGWPEGIPLGAMGGLYPASQTLQEGLGLDLAGNARLLFDGGKLLTPVEVTQFIIQNNTLVKFTPQDKTWSLTLTPATGLFSGTFTPNWSSPGKTLPAFQGVLLKSGPQPGGHGFFFSNRLGDLAPQSGKVTLESP